MIFVYLALHPLGCEAKGVNVAKNTPAHANDMFVKYLRNNDETDMNYVFDIMKRKRAYKEIHNIFSKLKRNENDTIILFEEYSGNWTQEYYGNIIKISLGVCSVYSGYNDVLPTKRSLSTELCSRINTYIKRIKKAKWRKSALKYSKNGVVAIAELSCSDCSIEIMQIESGADILQIANDEYYDSYNNIKDELKTKENNDTPNYIDNLRRIRLMEEWTLFNMALNGGYCAGNEYYNHILNRLNEYPKQCE